MFAAALLSIALIFGLSRATAGPETDDPARPTLGKTGQIFTLQFVPKAKRLTVRFVDQPLVSVGPARVVVRGRLFPAEGQAQELNVHPLGDSFEILDRIDPNSALEFEVRDLRSNQTEKLKLEQKTKP